MLEILTSWALSFWLDTSPVKTLKPVNWSSWLDRAWVDTMGQPTLTPDPRVGTVVQQHLAAMSAVGLPTTGQGVWIQSENQVVAENLGTTPLSAASLTKIATTLVALSTWGPDHRFETLISTNGPIEAGVLKGDLIVQGSADPFFVWEEAIALGNALQQAGINRVTGNLVIAGNFAMNFETNPVVAGRLLKQGVDASQWNAEITAQHQTLPSGTPRPSLVIDGDVTAISAMQAAREETKPVVRHQSLPLAQILKAMNIYSNNAMSEMLADSLGGGRAVAQKAAEVARVPANEIQLINGSGLGEANRISPRAVVAMMVAVQRYLQTRQLNIADIFPVIGRDGGTIGGRRIPAGSALKTGTLNAVSSLAGVVPTRDRGLVWFAIINLGDGDLGYFHDQQDVLLQKLEQQWGKAPSIDATITPANFTNEASFQLGAASRNEIIK